MGRNKVNVSPLSQGHLGDPSTSGMRGPSLHFLHDPTLSLCYANRQLQSPLLGFLGYCLSHPALETVRLVGGLSPAFLTPGPRIRTPRLALRKPACEPRRDSGANSPNRLLKSGTDWQKATEQRAEDT